MCAPQTCGLEVGGGTGLPRPGHRPQAGAAALSHRASGDSQTAARPAGALGMLSCRAPGSRVGSLCAAAAEPAGAHGERAGLAAAAAGRRRRSRAGTGPEPRAEPPTRRPRRPYPRRAGAGCGWRRRGVEEPRRRRPHPRLLPRPGRVPEPSGMEPWKQCAQWLIHCKVLPANHRVTWDSAQVFDLAQTLRDGVLLCQLLNNLRAHSINLKEINLRPQMSQVREPARAPPPPAGVSH